jgi:hypothetical protein
MTLARIRQFSLLSIILLAPAFGQTGATLVGTGYQSPLAGVTVAPGQVTTFFLTGAGTITGPQRATTLPLPATLAGFSAVLNQQNFDDGTQQFVNVLTESIPLIAVEQVNVCRSGAQTSAACLITELTLQIPSDAFPAAGTAGLATSVVISDLSGQSQSFNVLVMNQNIHILQTCDLVFPDHNVSCQDTVTHLDGTLVTPNSPASPGEGLVIYAVGLGRTVPLVAAGQPTPSPAPTVPIVVSYTYTNSSASAALSPTFAGLTPTQVGL